MSARIGGATSPSRSPRPTRGDLAAEAVGLLGGARNEGATDLRRLLRHVLSFATFGLDLRSLRGTGASRGAIG